MNHPFLDGIAKLSAYPQLSAIGGTLADVPTPQSGIAQELMLGMGVPLSAQMAVQPALNRLSASGGLGRRLSTGTSWGAIFGLWDALRYVGAPVLGRSFHGTRDRMVEAARNYGSNLARNNPFLGYYIARRMNAAPAQTAAARTRVSARSTPTVRSGVPTQPRRA